MSVLLEFAMFPTDRGESVSAEVSQLIELIRSSGVSHQLTAMGTIIETDSLEQALELVQRCYQRLEQAGCRRVYSSLKLDIRQGPVGRMQGKVAAVEARLANRETS